MFNNEQQSHCSMPRISFSGDFADAQQMIKHESSYREPPVSSDFEFSVSRLSMISADELIAKGKLLPLKEQCTKMTLRDELLVEDECDDVLPRIPKGSGWWKERLLGLKKAHTLPKKGHKCEELHNINAKQDKRPE